MSKSVASLPKELGEKVRRFFEELNDGCKLNNFEFIFFMGDEDGTVLSNFNLSHVKRPSIIKIFRLILKHYNTGEMFAKQMNDFLQSLEEDKNA